MPTGTPEPIRGLRYFAWAMLLCVPLCALGLLASPNEYRDMGIQGGIDCDGPLSVLLFAVPAFLVYLAGLAAFARSTRRTGGARYAAVAIASGLVCLALGFAIASASEALLSADHRSSCGGGL